MRGSRGFGFVMKIRGNRNKAWATEVSVWLAAAYVSVCVITSSNCMHQRWQTTIGGAPISAAYLQWELAGGNWWIEERARRLGSGEGQESVTGDVSPWLHRLFHSPRLLSPCVLGQPVVPLVAACSVFLSTGRKTRHATCLCAVNLDKKIRVHSG